MSRYAGVVITASICVSIDRFSRKTFRVLQILRSDSSPHCVDCITLGHTGCGVYELVRRYHWFVNTDFESITCG